MDETYKHENWLIVFLKDYYFFIYGFIFFSLISLFLKDLIAIILCIGLYFVCLIFRIFILIIDERTKIVIFSDNIIIKQNVEYIYSKYKYKIIEFKTRGTWKGIKIFGENEKNCKIWKNEFKNYDWKKIKENLIEFCIEYNYEDDLSGLKYSSFLDN